MIARAASSQPSALAFCRELGQHRLEFGGVERFADDAGRSKKNLPLGAPVAAAASFAESFTASLPVLPVKALALPELTSSARALPPSTRARHQSTGAEGISIW